MHQICFLHKPPHNSCYLIYLSNPLHISGRTILDFHFKMLIFDVHTTEVARTAYLGNFAVCTNVTALLCLLLGVRNVQKRFGLSVSLALLPVMIGGLVFLLKINPILAVSFWIMVFAKAINYALNQPSIQQLFIPTTKDSKYKAKAFIEMFGSRGSKAIGSGVNVLRKVMNPGAFLVMSTAASLGLVGIWFFIALYLGRTCVKAAKENRVVC